MSIQPSGGLFVATVDEAKRFDQASSLNCLALQHVTRRIALSWSNSPLPKLTEER